MSSGRPPSSSSSATSPRSRRLMKQPAAETPEADRNAVSVPPLPLPLPTATVAANSAAEPREHRSRSSRSGGGSTGGDGDKKRSSSSRTKEGSSHDKDEKAEKGERKEGDAGKGGEHLHHRQHHHLSRNAILRQIHHDLSFTGGVNTMLVTPASFLRIALAVLQHTLRSFSPETLVVKRVSRRRTTTTTTNRDNEDDDAATASEVGSRASSRHSRSSSSRSLRQQQQRSSSRTGAAAAGGDLDTSAMSTTRYAHRRHRSTSSEQRRQHSSSGAGTDSPAPDAASAASLSRRSRASTDAVRRRSASADGSSRSTDREDLAAAKEVRRSRSDESRLSGSKRKQRSDGATVSSDRSAGGDGGTGGLSSSMPQSSANSSFGSNHGLSSMLGGGSGGHGGLAGGGGHGLPPPPPMIGKPPLSGRRRPTSPSSAGAALVPPSGTPPLSPRSSHHRPQQHHRSSSSTHTHEEGEEEEEVAEGPRRRRDKVKPYTTWREWLHAIDATQPARLLAHILRATPVAALHFVCELKRQLVTLPMLQTCTDVEPAVQRTLARFTGTAATGHQGRQPATTAAKPPQAGAAHRDDADWMGTRLGANFILLRVVLRMWHRYLEDSLFLDSSLVVRNLRSKRFSRQVAGWVLRLASHVVFDPIFLSVLSPLLCLPAADFADKSGGVKYTIPGILRGLALGGAAFLVERVVMPTCSQLVNRAVITICEATEYVLMRRYVMKWSDDDDDDDEEEGNTDGDGNVDQEDGAVSEGESQASVSPATTPRGTSAAKKKGKSRKETDKPTTPPLTAAESAEAKRGTDKSANAASGGKDAAATAEEEEQRAARRQRRKAQKERLERRKAKQLRQERREAAARHAILRAIGYRIAGGLLAQCLVEHPMGVVVELLRGRAVMHMTGMLTQYHDMARENPETAVYMASWANVKQLVREGLASSPLAHDATRAGSDEGGQPVPVVVRILRRVGADAGHEVVTLSATALEISGQAVALERLTRDVTDKMLTGGRPTARESVELMGRWLLSFSPLFYGVQFTAIDKLLGFYMAVWTRLTRK